MYHDQKQHDVHIGKFVHYIVPSGFLQIDVTINVDILDVLAVDKTSRKERRLTTVNDEGYLSADKTIVEVEKYKGKDNNINPFNKF